MTIHSAEPVTLVNLLLLPLLSLIPTDSALSWEDLHGLLCSSDLHGLFLPGQPYPGCGGHGLRGAESGNHRWGLAEGERVSDGHGTTEKRAKSKCSALSYFHVRLQLKTDTTVTLSNNFIPCEAGSKKTSTGDRLSVVPGAVSILCEVHRKYTKKQQQKKTISQDAIRRNGRRSCRTEDGAPGRSNGM